MNTAVPDPTFAILDLPGERQAAGFALRSLRVALEESALARSLDEQVAMLSALHAHRSAEFILQFHAVPSGLSGTVSSELLVVVPKTPDHGESSLLDIVDDVSDLLVPQTRWYLWDPIDDEARLRSGVSPFTATSCVEILRRKERVGADIVSHSTGFLPLEPSTTTKQLWSYWRFPTVADSRRRLIDLMLVQDDPVLLRVQLRPTSLTIDEESALDDLVASWPAPDQVDVSSGLSGVQAARYFEQPFEMQVLLASPRRLSPAFIATVGSTISPSAREAANLFFGGYDLRSASESATLLAAFHDLDFAPAASQDTHDALVRLRRLFEPWEALAAARIPVAHMSGIPGFELIRTPALPASVDLLPSSGTEIGLVHVHNTERPVFVDGADRFRHAYVLGQTGTGKSTLLLNMAQQDIADGAGVAVIDPHGDLVEMLLERIPEDRVDDVVLVDPSDPEAVVGLNLLEADSDVQAEYLISDLCEFFQQLFDPRREGIVGPRFQSWLRYAALTLVSVPTEGTICDVPRLFTDDEYLKHCFKYVADPFTQDFWIDEMAQTDQHTKSEMLGWFNSKFEPFRQSRMMRHVVGQSQSTINISSIMDNQQILLVNLSKGLMGEFNSSLLGYVVFAKIWTAALSRASQPLDDRVPFYLYADEFQNVTSTALPAVLSEARKYRLSIVMANQFFSQVNESVRDAILGNVGSKVAFRVGPKDATLFAEMQPGTAIQPEHLRRLPNFVALAQLLSNGEPLDPFQLETVPAPPGKGATHATKVRSRSREQWARSHDWIENQITESHRV